MPFFPTCPNCHQVSSTRWVHGKGIMETFEIICQSPYCTFRPATLERTLEGAEARWIEAVNDKRASRLLKRHQRVSNEKLLDKFKKAGLGPAVVSQHHDGKCSLIWHVDDDNDRYVEATDSLYSSKVVLTARDGYCDWLESMVLSGPADILDWVKRQLEAMSRVQSPNGRPAYKIGSFQTRGVG